MSTDLVLYLADDVCIVFVL